MSAPKLRFPGFVGEWEDKPLGSVASFSKGKGISKADISTVGTTPCIRYGELYTHYGTRIDEVLSATDVPVPELKLSQGGEVIVPASGEDAKDIATAAVVLRRGVALGGDLNIIRSASDGFFLASYIAGKKRLTLAAMAQGNSVVHLYPAQLGSLALSFPTLPEQQKIAAFLGVVDAKLAALAARQAALGWFKAGLMQKLFSQQLRFTREGGTAFPDWEERRLGDVFTWVKTNSLSREFLTHDGGEVQNIHYGDIHTKFRPLFRQPAEKAPFVGANSALKPFTDEEYCRVGDVVIADASEDYADIGKAIEIVEVRERSLVAGLHTYIARPKIGSLVVGFSGYLLRSAPMRRQIMRIAQGISVLGVSKGNLEELTFWVPHPDEQAKIASALSAMDAKIQAVADQVAKLQTFKKGLLQQMFV